MVWLIWLRRCNGLEFVGEGCEWSWITVLVFILGHQQGHIFSLKWQRVFLGVIAWWPLWWSTPLLDDALGVTYLTWQAPAWMLTEEGSCCGNWENIGGKWNRKVIAPYCSGGVMRSFALLFPWLLGGEVGLLSSSFPRIIPSCCAPLESHLPTLSSLSEAMLNNIDDLERQEEDLMTCAWLACFDVSSYYCEGDHRTLVFNNSLFLIEKILLESLSFLPSQRRLCPYFLSKIDRIWNFFFVILFHLNSLLCPGSKVADYWLSSKQALQSLLGTVVRCPAWERGVSLLNSTLAFVSQK